MTLCVAWVRTTGQPPELLFATDSRLNTPGRWDVGLKLFELPRRGALIAFHGTASFAHTLIQHAEHDLLERPEFQSCQCDLHDLVEPLCGHFSRLFADFRDASAGFVKEVVEVEKQGTGFLLGGWSWRQQGHVLWRLAYRAEERRFAAVPVTATDGSLFAFVGDGWQEAEQEVAGETELHALDMQPLRVLLARTHPDNLTSTVGGPLQAAKVYGSGRVEFFAVAWPTADAEVFKRAARFSRGEFRHAVYLDPATGGEISILPERLPVTDNYDWGAEDDFIRRCYPAENGYRLKSDLPEHEQLRLITALKAVGFQRLLQSFSPGHTVASKLLTSQVGRLREIASRVQDDDIRLQIEELLTEPFSEDADLVDQSAGTEHIGDVDE